MICRLRLLQAMGNNYIPSGKVIGVVRKMHHRMLSLDGVWGPLPREVLMMLSAMDTFLVFKGNTITGIVRPPLWLYKPYVNHKVSH